MAETYTISVAGLTTEAVTVNFKQYQNGRPAIVLDRLDGERWAVATVNLPNEPMAADEIAVKDHAENAGMLRFLRKNGIVREPHRCVRSGYVQIPICRLTPKAQALLEEVQGVS